MSMGLTPQTLHQSAGASANPAAVAAAAGTGAAAATGAPGPYAEWAHPHVRQQSESRVHAPIQEEEEGGRALVSK
jgi:hypothetical protein